MGIMQVGRDSWSNWGSMYRKLDPPSQLGGYSTVEGREIGYSAK